MKDWDAVYFSIFLTTYRTVRRDNILYYRRYCNLLVTVTRRNVRLYLHSGSTCLEALELLVRTNIPYFGLSIHHDGLHKYQQVVFFCPVFRPVRKIAKFDSLVRRVCHSAGNNSAPTGQIFMKFDIRGSKKICWKCSSFIQIWEE
jgi:hypothetical protein